MTVIRLFGYHHEQVTRESAKRLGIVLTGEWKPCTGCLAAKVHRETVPTSMENRSTDKLGQGFTDLAGRVKVSIVHGSNYESNICITTAAQRRCLAVRACGAEPRRERRCRREERRTTEPWGERRRRDMPGAKKSCRRHGPGVVSNGRNFGFTQTLTDQQPRSQPGPVQPKEPDDHEQQDKPEPQKPPASPATGPCSKFTAAERVTSTLVWPRAPGVRVCGGTSETAPFKRNVE